MFKKVLIANRGEIALRIHRACHEMGIKTVAVHSTADAEAMHVRLADEAVCIGPAASTDSYLNIANIIAACEVTGADAVHPGYGFLSENAKFADICEEHGIKFIGPSADHIRMMGDKITAKETVKKLGIPVVPGSAGGIDTDEDAIRIAAEVGYPVIVKATAGGGGRGMQIVRDEKGIVNAVRTCKTEAKASFGNPEVYIEKFLEKPRHIEFQVMGDQHGNCIHLGERDCSLQRRHQKVLEEAPSPVIDMETRMRVGGIVSDAMANFGYEGAGTIEFLYEDGEFYFIEMNTRLQVEHPVTEMITGIDIVREQIRVAAGKVLHYTQDMVEFHGHAMECRVNAEDPYTFMPSPGLVSQYHAPGGLNVRADSAVYTGYRIPPYYDSMVAKLIVKGYTRDGCMMRLSRSLEEYVIEGITTTIPLHMQLLQNEDFQTGNYDIHWLEKFLDKHNSEAAAAKK